MIGLHVTDLQSLHEAEKEITAEDAYRLGKQLRELGFNTGIYVWQNSFHSFRLEIGDGPRFPGSIESSRIRLDEKTLSGVGSPETYMISYANGNVRSERRKVVKGNQQYGYVRRGDCVHLLETAHYMKSNITSGRRKTR